MQPELVLTSDFFLSFIKLITIHGVPRSRELIIHVTIRVRQRIWSKQHVGQCVGQNVGRHLSPVGILSQKVYLGEDNFFVCIVKLTYQKCSFTFPLLLIQIRAEKLALFSLSCDKPHSFREFYVLRRYWWIFTLCDCYSKTKVRLILTSRPLLGRSTPCLQLRITCKRVETTAGWWRQKM